jgi:hypothetical protein
MFRVVKERIMAIHFKARPTADLKGSFAILGIVMLEVKGSENS